MNLLEDKSVLMYQLASKINNFDKIKICMPALAQNVHVNKSNLHFRHLGLMKFREGSDF